MLTLSPRLCRIPVKMGKQYILRFDLLTVILSFLGYTYCGEWIPEEEVSAEIILRGTHCSFLFDGARKVNSFQPCFHFSTVSCLHLNTVIRFSSCSLLAYRYCQNRWSAHVYWVRSYFTLHSVLLYILIFSVEVMQPPFRCEQHCQMMGNNTFSVDPR